jgi:hypothetical protein
MLDDEFHLSGASDEFGWNPVFVVADVSLVFILSAEGNTQGISIDEQLERIGTDDHACEQGLKVQDLEFSQIYAKNRNSNPTGRDGEDQGGVQP